MIKDFKCKNCQTKFEELQIEKEKPICPNCNRDDCIPIEISVFKYRKHFQHSSWKV